MSYKNILITSSISSIPSQSYGQRVYIPSSDEQHFQLEQFTGSSAGSVPDLLGQTSSVDLFVNISQSWSGSILTPQGIVQFVHNTQDEFYNGEYSGSDIIVTNQKVIDDDCINFLTPNTTILTYNPFFYYSSGSNPILLGDFLNQYTAPSQGQVYFYYDFNTNIRRVSGFTYPSPGIYYVKVNKIDNEGDDNSLSLQELTNFRIRFRDIGVIDYNIINITEYSTYYLYQIYNNSNTSSLDNNILNYTFSASVHPFTIPILSEHTVTTVSIITDSLSYFNASSNVYIYGDTPNIKIIFTASITMDKAGDIFLRNQNGAVFTTSWTASGTFLVTGSFSPVETDFYYLTVDNLDPVNTASISNLQWQFTQSVNPNSISDLCVLEPYLTNTFSFSDCDVLMNNISENTINSRYMEVLYDTGILTPSNYQQIISQSAQLAEINPYNYKSNANILPRYKGVRLNQQNTNIWTMGDDSFGKTPSVQTLVDKFAVFDWMGGADYEVRTNGAGVHITQLVDPSGNITALTGDNTNLITVEQLFHSKDYVSIYYTTSSTSNKNLTASIFDGGSYYDSLIATSGSIGYSNNFLERGGLTYVSSSGTPFFVLSGSQQESSVLRANYSWAQYLLNGFYYVSGAMAWNSKLFPIKQYDFIRFFPSSSIDDYYILQGDSGSFNVERRIMSSSIDGTNYVYLYLDNPISASHFPSASNDQGFRIFRRIPSENFVYINNYQAGSGLLIPSNYNPDYDYISIARKIGIL